MRLQISIVILAISFAPTLCAHNQQQPTPAWQKLCVVLGLMIVATAAMVYKLTHQQVLILKQYISPGQSEITFINFKTGSDCQVQDTTEDDPVPDSQTRSTEHDRDEEMSIDEGKGQESRNLSELFTSSGNQKKSKSRKRMASVVKIATSQQS